MVTFTYCPEPDCGALAEIADRHCLHSSDGLIEHVTTCCLHQHRFLLPAEMLAAATRRRVNSG